MPLALTEPCCFVLLRSLCVNKLQAQKKEPSSLRKDGLTSLLQRSTVSVVCFVLFHGLKGIKHAAGRAGVLLRALSNWAPGCCEAGCPASRACVWVSSLSSHTHTHSHAHAHALTRTHLTRCIPTFFFFFLDGPCVNGVSFCGAMTIPTTPTGCWQALCTSLLCNFVRRLILACHPKDRTRAVCMLPCKPQSLA